MKADGASGLDQGNRVYPWGHVNVTKLAEKEPELVREVELYQLDLVGLTYTHSIGSGTKLMDRGYALPFAGVAQGVRCWAGVAFLTR